MTPRYLLLIASLLAIKPVTRLLEVAQAAVAFAMQRRIAASLDERTCGPRRYSEVCDRGPGIPDTELNAVMQPFYRLEHSRNRDTGGTGLGLAIAQQLTIALGGTLTLSNREHGGLRACVRLPSSS